MGLQLKNVQLGNFLNGKERSLETRGSKVNMNMTKLMVMSREPVVRPQRGRYPYEVCGKGVGVNSIWCQYSYIQYSSHIPQIFSVGIWACLLAMPCWWGPIRPKQLSMAANIQAHSFFKGFSTGLVPLTRKAIVPYLVTVSFPQHSYMGKYYVWLRKTSLNIIIQ